MADLAISVYDDYEAFADDLNASETDTRMYWQLLGQLAAEELLVELPAWLAEEKVGYVEGATPTRFVGRIERETDQALLLEESAAARPLLKLAHRIHELETNQKEADRSDWLTDRLADHRTAFEQREDAATLADGWLPKSQIEWAARRSDSSN